jgi:chromosome segregation ATPase
MQRLEEQRLRRSGVELQEMFESLRQQFTEVSAKSQRVDDVRRQLVERIEAVEETVSTLRTDDDSTRKEIERLDKTEMEHYLSQQDRIETIRIQVEASLSEMRQVADQRIDRYTNRFLTVDERLRNIEQLLSEIPPRFEALERRDETIGAEADSIEEWLVMKQLAAMESVLEEVRKKRAERSTFLPRKSSDGQASSGSSYYPHGLLKSVRDARPPIRKDSPAAEDDRDE